MKVKKNYIYTLFVAVLLGLTLLWGCGTDNSASAGKEDASREEQTGQEPGDDTESGQVQTRARQRGQIRKLFRSGTFPWRTFRGNSTPRRCSGSIR